MNLAIHISHTVFVLRQNIQRKRQEKKKEECEKRETGVQKIDGTRARSVFEKRHHSRIYNLCAIIVHVFKKACIFRLVFGMLCRILLGCKVSSYRHLCN